MTGHVTGLDLSLAGSGIVSVRCADAVRVSKRLIDSVAFPQGYRPTLAEWVGRQTPVIHEAIACVEPGGLVVVEAPAYGAKYGNPHERAGIWWAVVRHLVRRGDVVAQVTPKTRAKYAAGRGSADKREVVAAVNERMPFAHITDHNLADGLALAAMGWRRLGRPIDGVATRPMDEAMRAVRWPETKGMAA